MNKTCLAALALAMTQALTAAALEITITPGSLAKEMVKLESTRDAEVVLKGTANVTDLMLLPRISDHVTALDMSGLAIAAYTYTSGGYKGRMEFAAGELVPDMLAGTQIRQLTLPATATRIGNNALAPLAPDVGDGPRQHHRNRRLRIRRIQRPDFRHHPGKSRIRSRSVRGLHGAEDRDHGQWDRHGDP